jgi:hypothetical protein
MSITYSGFVCVLVASGIQHAMRTRRIFTCGLSGSTLIFPHYPINGTILGGKKLFNQTRFYFLFNFCPKHLIR